MLFPSQQPKKEQENNQDKSHSAFCNIILEEAYLHFWYILVIR